ncbi:hypothetical protein HAX54_032490 [Datura stramonium]|uniref:Uncharacterized protein n=1 Tax=Datura stramonium TaxID=4076 RepID=A0ABS8VAR7_DATST|nr:hypothetical protein [Datura stramonium]
MELENLKSLLTMASLRVEMLLLSERVENGGGKMVKEDDFYRWRESEWIGGFNGGINWNNGEGEMVGSWGHGEGKKVKKFVARYSSVGLHQNCISQVGTYIS